MLPEPAVDPVGRAQQRLARHAGGVGPEGFQGGDVLEQFRGDEALLLLGELGHADAWDELGAEVEGAVVFKDVLEAREGDVGVGLEVGQDGGVGLP